VKTQRKNRRPLNLKTRNSRWKWMAGATAATAAGVTASQASTITINLVNNYIDPFGDSLNADLTGDGHPDLTIVNAYYAGANRANVTLNGVGAFCHYDVTQRFYGTMVLGSRVASYFGPDSTSPAFGTPSLMGSIPIFFKDLHINGGAPTRGLLEVTVDPFEIQLDSITYTSTTLDQRVSSIPDQGSSLALLAMGAGGILALRRWRTAQGRS
jgi:hypothetical protein